MRSYYHAKSQFDFIQYGSSSSPGFTRNFPYAYKSYDEPTSCFILNTSVFSSCASEYYSSKCTDPSAASYPSYDPKCRTWYHEGLELDNPQMVSFEAPRIASSNNFDITAVNPIKPHWVVGSGPGAYGGVGNEYGVINVNIKDTVLSDAINAVKILESGYVYIVDSRNVTVIISHPNLASGCGDVYCAESSTGLSWNEYVMLYENVLAPIQCINENPLSNSCPTISTQYTKNGAEWRIEASSFEFELVHYTVLATVPLSEILHPVNEVDQQITQTQIVIIVVFCIGYAIFGVGLLFICRKLIDVVVSPIDELRMVLQKVLNDDLGCTVGDCTSSLDMKLLYTVFSNLVVALRFGSDSYGRGDISTALAVFTDALHLFTSSENAKGIGAAHNNLGVVYLSQKDFIKSEEHFKAAIQNAEVLLKSGMEELMTLMEKQKSHPSTELETQVKKCKYMVRSYKRVLSDRKGNLAMCFLEKGSFEDTFAALEPLLKEDKKSNYIRGCVIKQGNLGHYYLKQGETSSAEKIFFAALEFIQKEEDEFKHQGVIEDGIPDHVHAEVNSWNNEECESAEQTALYNIALYYSSVQKSKEAELYYLNALCKPKTMHVATCSKILVELLSLYTGGALHCAPHNKVQLTELSTMNKFDLDGLRMSTSTAKVISKIKRVALLVDYSGSMSGSKINSAMTNMKTLFNEHIHDDDWVMLAHFNSKVKVDFPLLRKKGNEAMMLSRMDALKQPNGATAFYCAIHESIIAMQQAYNSANKTVGNNWIIALTDGEDSMSSGHTYDSIYQELKALEGSKYDINLIIIGVGSDVDSKSLENLAKATPEGTYVSANSDSASIKEAFSQVIATIQGQMVLESF